MGGFTTLEDVAGFAIVLAAIAVATGVVASSRLNNGLKALICGALVLRVVGSWLRYTILFEVYGGSGDAQGYYGRGIGYAERFIQLDLSPFYDPGLWFRGTWLGTSFMSFPSGIVLTLIGPSIVGEFLAFSLLAFVGLLGFALAFRQEYPEIPLQRYARWIWLFPSLWFWPSSVGKEAVIFMGLGLAVRGFIGRNSAVNWPLLIVGMFFVFATRSEVAAVLACSLMLAYWFSLGGSWSIGRAVQGVMILGIALFGIRLSMGEMGVESFDVEGVQTFMETTSAGAADRGSSVQRVDVGIAGAPRALLNILTRPFPWEARNAMALLSALEIMAFWGIVWYRRRNLLHSLRNWRSHALLRLALPFILVYSISLGMLVVNLGIIARQRVFLFPFLFLLLEAAPAPERSERRSRRQPPAAEPSNQPHPVGIE